MRSTRRFDTSQRPQTLSVSTRTSLLLLLLLPLPWVAADMESNA